MSVTVSPSADYRIRTHTNKVRHSSTYLGLFLLDSVLNHQFQSSSLSLALKLSSEEFDESFSAIRYILSHRLNRVGCDSDLTEIS